MILPAWATGPFHYLALVLAFTSAAASLFLARLRGGWWRYPLAFVFPVWVLGSALEATSNASSGEGVRNATWLLLVYAAVRFAWIAGWTAKAPWKDRFAPWLASAIPLGAAALLVPASLHALSFVHDERVAAFDAHAARAVEEVREKQRAWKAAHGTFAPADALDAPRDVELRDAQSPTDDEWAIVIVPSRECALCRSYAVESKGAVHVAEGREATLADRIVPPYEIEMAESLRQPPPAEYRR